MGYEFNNDTPIFIQIIEIIKVQIINKKYLPNDKLPSVRELSMLYEVNPNTIQKALSELEEIGLIYTERTNGKFVTNDKKVIDKITKETVNKKIEDFYQSMQTLGFDKNKVLEILNNRG